MATVDRNIYPIVSQNTAIIKSQNLSQFGLNEEWNDSAAVSMSTRANAPFNQITSFAHYANTEYKNVYQKAVQKIAFWCTNWQTSAPLSSYYQFKNTTQENMSFGDPSDYPCVWANRRASNLGSWWNTKFAEWGIHPDPTYYSLITGLNSQNILGVICCGFRDNTYCSLSYYNDHKTTLSNPSFLFVRFIVHGDNDFSYDRDVFPFDLSSRDFVLYTMQSDNTTITAEHSSAEPFFDLYPPYMGGQYSRLFTPSESSPYVDATNGGYPSLFAPLMACCGGGRMPDSEPFNPSTAQRTHAHFIYGGEYGVDYTLSLENGYYYPVLTEHGLSQAFALAATYGLPFSAEFPDTWSSLYTSDINTYMPVANDGGFFDGSYELLTSNGTVSTELSPANAAIWNGGVNAPYNDRTYDPNIPIPADAIDLTEPTLTGIDCFNKTYVLNRDDVESLGGYFWSADDNVLDKIVKAFTLFGEKPINGVINLMLFPFNVRSKTGATQQEYIKIGAWTSDIYVYRLPQTAHAVYDFGSFNWRRNFDNFLDYAPFTTAELYVPFFGVFPLANENFIGKTIDIKCIVDFITGAATCVIYVTDGDKRQPVIYKNATIGVQIPVSGDDVAQRVTALLDNGLKLGGDVAEGLTSAAMHDVGGVADAAISGAAHAFGAAAVPTVFNSAGGSSPECALYLPKKPYLILHIADTAIPENYGHTVGYACEKTVTIGDVSGFARFANVDVSGIVATSQELDEIKTLLETGVYC